MRIDRHRIWAQRPIQPARPKADCEVTNQAGVTFKTRKLRAAERSRFETLCFLRALYRLRGTFDSTSCISIDDVIQAAEVAMAEVAASSLTASARSGELLTAVWPGRLCPRPYLEAAVRYLLDSSFRATDCPSIRSKSGEPRVGNFTNGSIPSTPDRAPAGT